MPLNIKLLKSVFNLKSLGFKRGYRKYKLSLFCEGGRGVCASKNVPIFFVPISEGGRGKKRKGQFPFIWTFFFEGIPKKNYDNLFNTHTVCGSRYCR